jgi:hypothetical protein
MPRKSSRLGGLAGSVVEYVSTKITNLNLLITKVIYINNNLFEL